MAWRTSAELAGPGLNEALETAGRSLGTERPDIQGQRLVEVVAWLLALPAAQAQHAGDPLPDLSVANTRLWIEPDPPDGVGTRFEDGGPSDIPLNTHLLAHLEPLIEAVSTTTKRPARALWRGATDRLAGALVWVGQMTGAPEASIEVLATQSVAGAPPLRGRAELRHLDGQLVHVREGCCLYYRVPTGCKCWSCPLLSDAERRALVSASA